MAKIVGFVIGFLGALAGAIVLWWKLIVPAVPASAYHDLILIGVTLASIVLLGGFVLGVASVVGLIVALLVELVRRRGKKGS